MEFSGVAKPGDTNIVAGVTFVFSGRIWLEYPKTAHDLIQHAQSHGWGFDDGLPPRVGGDDVVYIRVLIGREAGENALVEGESVPGMQYHMLWRMPHPRLNGNKHLWSLGPIHVKTSDDPVWKPIRFVKAVRSGIASNPVVVPSGLVPANA